MKNFGIIVFLAIGALTYVEAQIAVRKFPHHVSLNLNGIHHCSGSLISRNLVLTAASCLNNIPLKSLRVVIASDSLTENPGLQYTVDSVIEHPEASPDKIGDIALVKLTESLSWTTNTKSILISTTDYSNSLNVSLTLSGWLRISANSPIGDKLQMTEFASISRKICQKTWAVTTNEICAVPTFANKYNRCIIDLGSPLMIKNNGVYALLGVATYTQPCGSHLPDVFTNIMVYKKWIESYTL